MASPNYKFHKRQKELARQKKKEEKKGRKEPKDEASSQRSNPPELAAFYLNCTTSADT